MSLAGTINDLHGCRCCRSRIALDISSRRKNEKVALLRCKLSPACDRDVPGIIHHHHHFCVVDVLVTNWNLPPTEQALRAQLEILQNHDSEHSASPAASRSPHGYDERQFTPSNDAGQPASTGVEAHIHPDLREAQSQAQAQAAESMMQMGPPGSHSPNSTGAPGPGAPLAPAPPSIPEDPRKPKRELSQSKRAAQNRAAQVS